MPKREPCDRAQILIDQMTEPDHKPDGSGLDDGPWLPGKGPRAKAAPKSKEQLAAIRAKAWATRRAVGTREE